MSGYKQAPLEVRVTTLAELREQGMTWAQIGEMVGASESVMYRDWNKGKGTLYAARTRRNRQLLRLAAEAPCLGLTEFTEDPLADTLGTEFALEICRGCTVADACLELTRPHEWFDGVCARRAWMDGRDVTETVHRRAAKAAKAELREQLEADPDPPSALEAIAS